MRTNTVLVVKGERPSIVSLVSARVPTAAQIKAFVGRSKMAKAANTMDSRRLIILKQLAIFNSQKTWLDHFLPVHGTRLLEYFCISIVILGRFVKTEQFPWKVVKRSNGECGFEAV